jgi:hypothetical protein
MEVPPAALLCFPLHSWGQTFPLSSQNFVTKMPSLIFQGRGISKVLLLYAFAVSPPSASYLLAKDWLNFPVQLVIDFFGF